MNRYPHAMYKGDYTIHEVRADMKVVNSAREEAALRKKGYLPGEEFFALPPVEVSNG